MSTSASDLSALIAAAAATVTAESQDNDTQPRGLHRCDVLIVDDSGASRELVSAILRNFAGRLDLREARNGQEALTMAGELNPRITLLDIDMPGTDGLSVLQTLRQARPDAFVAMISGGSSLDNVRKALALGASGFVIKPYKPQRILDLLNKYTQVTGHPLVR
jgi:two-component system, chemotaxis family, chemotaxis protein CheY